MTAARPAEAEPAARPGAEGDDVLVARVLSAGDEAAFDELYRRHTPSLYGTAIRLAARRADAEDAVHDAWVRAVEALRAFRWQSSLRTWLTGILVNRLRELERRDRRLELAPDLLDAEPAPPAEPSLPRGVDPMDLERAIAALPPGYRRVLVLHDAEGLTHEEIGALLGVAPGTSKSQLARARRSLRRALGA